MTAKHFNAIAATIRDTKFKSKHEKRLFIERMLFICSASNPNFDSNRFRDACGE